MRALPPPFYSTKGKAPNDTPHTPLTLKQLWPGMYLQTNVTGWGSLWTTQTTGRAWGACENSSSRSQVATRNQKVGDRLGHRRRCLGMLVSWPTLPEFKQKYGDLCFSNRHALQLIMWTDHNLHFGVYSFRFSPIVGLTLTQALGGTESWGNNMQ